jgi:transcriptional regulator with XRE-family HTH domain
MRKPARRQAVLREDEQRKAFARRLTTLRVNKGWSQSELARRAAMHTSSNVFGRDNISKYEKGTSSPLPLQLAALAKALGVPATDLMPERGGMLNEPMDETSTLNLKQVGKSRAWIRLNQEVPLSIAYKILELLHDRED